MKDEHDTSQLQALPAAAENDAATEGNITEAEAEPAATQEPTEPSTPPESPAPSADELAAMLAEAEQRGYLRGRNEQIELAMRAPSLWHESAPPCDDAAEELQPAILANLRPSVWNYES